MVSFVCNYCQNTLKKPKLDAHAQRCQNASFSCIDCGVDFSGTAYRQHTSCISEAEKYEGKLYKGNKKGASAQNKQNQQQKKLNSASSRSMSTVDQLTKKAKNIELETEVGSKPVQEKQKSKKRKKSSDGKKDSKNKKRSKSESVDAEWIATELPTDAVDALVCAIAHASQGQKPGLSPLSELKKLSIRLVVKHPKSKVEKSAAKKKFKKAVIEALSSGKVALTKC